MESLNQKQQQHKNQNQILQFSILNSKLFSISIYFSIYFGCFPKESLQFYKAPTLTTSSKWTSLFFPVLILLLHSFQQIDYLASNWNQLASFALSKALLYSSANIFFYFSDAFKRISFLMNYKTIFQLFQKICNEDGKVIKLSTIVNNSGIAWTGRKQLIWLIWIAFGLRFVKCLLQSFYFIYPSDDDLGDGSILFGDQNYKLRRIYGSFGETFSTFCAFSSKIASRLIILLIGIHLLDRYLELVHEFLHNIKTNVNHDNLSLTSVKPVAVSKLAKLPISSLDEVPTSLEYWKNFRDRFQQLQETFFLYNSASGFLLLVIIIDFITAFVFNMYRIVYEWKAANYWLCLSGIAGMTEHTIVIYAVVFVGELIRINVSHSAFSIIHYIRNLMYMGHNVCRWRDANMIFDVLY